MQRLWGATRAGPVRRGALAGLLLCGLAGCDGGTADPDVAWLGATLRGSAVVLEIGGQCDAESYLRVLRISAANRPLWEVSTQRPERRVDSVTVGQSPAGFTERENNLPSGGLTGTVSVTLKTNFWYGTDIDVGQLAEGRVVRYRPQPVMNENAPVGPRC